MKNKEKSVNLSPKEVKLLEQWFLTQDIERGSSNGDKELARKLGIKIKD